MHSDVDVTVAADVVLVSVTLDNPDPVPQRVRLRNRLDGPVLPPRRAGVPEPGWDDEGFEGVVPPESTIALGYACPTDDTSTPVSELDPDAVVTLDVLGHDGERDAAPASPTDAIRQLGPARPPADAVPAGESLTTRTVNEAADEGINEDADVGVNEDIDGGSNDGLVELPSAQTRTPPAQTRTPPAQTRTPPAQTRSPPEPTDGDVAMAVSETDPLTDESVSRSSSCSARSAFLVACERRLELAERLDGASVRTAAAALEASDVSVDAVESLDADRERLRRLAARATELADRAADADPNVDALRRMA